MDPMTAMAAWTVTLAGVGALVWAAGKAGRIAEADDSEDGLKRQASVGVEAVSAWQEKPRVSVFVVHEHAVRHGCCLTFG